MATRRASRLLRCVRGLLLLLALVGGAYLLRNHPTARSLLALRVSALVSDQIPGELRILAIGRIELGEVSDVDAELYDRRGRRIVAIRGLRVQRASILSLLRAFMDAEHAVPIILPRIYAETVTLTCPPNESPLNVIRDSISSGQKSGRPLWIDAIELRTVQANLPGAWVDRVTLHRLRGEGFFSHETQLALRAEKALVSSGKNSIEGRAIELELEGTRRARVALEARHSLGLLRVESALDGTDLALEVTAAAAETGASAELRFSGRLPNLAGEALVTWGERSLRLRDLESIHFDPDSGRGSAVVPSARFEDGPDREMVARLAVRLETNPAAVEIEARDLVARGGGARFRSIPASDATARLRWVASRPNELSAAIEGLELSRFEVPGLDLAGELSFHAQGSITNGAFEAALASSARALRVNGATVGECELTGKIAGDPSKARDSRVSLAARGRAVKIGEIRARRFSAHLEGPVSAPTLSIGVEQAGRAWNGSARVVIGADQVELQRAIAAVRASGATLKAKVRRLIVARGGVRGDALELSSGNSRLRGSIRAGPSASQAVLEGAVDLGVVARVFGLPSAVEGELELDGQLEMNARDAHGDVRYALAPKAGSTQPLAVRGTAHFAGRTFETLAEVSSGDWGGTVGARVELAGAPLTRQAWTRAREIEISAVSTREVRIPLGDSELVARSGKVSATLVARRKALARVPDLLLSASAEDIATPAVIGSVAPEVGALNAAATLELSGATGELSGSAVVSGHGRALVEGAIQAELELGRLISDPGAYLRAVRDLPIDARVRVLPFAARVPGVRGLASASVRLDGTIRRPRWRGAAEVRDIRAETDEAASPLDLEAAFTAEAGTLSVDVFALQRRHRVAEGRLLFSLEDQRDFAVHAESRRFPLALLAPWSDRRVAGDLSGTISLRREGGPLLGTLAIEGRALRFAETPLPPVSFDATFDRASARAKISSRAADGSRFSLSSRALRNGSSNLLGIDWGSPVDVALSAERFALGSWVDLAAGSEIRAGGRLDADLAGSVALSGLDGCPRVRSSLTGHLDLEAGHIRIPEMGLRVQHLRLHAIARPAAGAQTLSVAGQGRFPEGGTTHGSAWFRLADGDANRFSGQVRMNLKEAPVKWQGVTFGEITGNASVTLAGDNYVKMRITPAVLKLRRSLRSGVIAPEDPETVEIEDAPVRVSQGARASAGRLSCPKPDPWRGEVVVENLKVTSGGFVESLFSDSSLDADVTGKVEFELAERPYVDTRLQVARGGHVEVGGKVFTVEEGALRVTQAGGVQHVYMLTTASWRARDMTHIYSDISYGPKASGPGWERKENVTFDVRSVPPRPRSEVLDILISGRPRTVSGSSVSYMRGHKNVALEALYAAGKVPSGEPADPLNLAAEWDVNRNTALRYQLGSEFGSRFDLVWRFRY